MFKRIIFLLINVMNCMMGEGRMKITDQERNISISLPHPPPFQRLVNKLRDPSSGPIGNFGNINMHGVVGGDSSNIDNDNNDDNNINDQDHIFAIGSKIVYLKIYNIYNLNENR